MSLRKFTKRIFILSTFGAVFLYLLSCSSVLLDPSKYWWIALMGVTYAGWLVVVIGFLCFWIFFRSKWALLPLMALIIGWPVTHNFFAFHPFQQFEKAKAPNSIRVMQWNVRRWDEMNKYWAPEKKSKRLKMFDYIAAHQIDVLCVQEFFESNNRKEFNYNLPYLVDTLGFKYHYFAVDHVRWDSIYKTGVAIFSKYPIVDTFRKRYGGPDSLKNNESFIYADINIHGKKIRVFTSHLQSMLFGGNDYKRLRELKQSTDSAVETTMGLAKKFRRAYQLRMNQVQRLKPFLNNSPYPEIFCGDFNEVPSSQIYVDLKGNRQDAFIKKGFGIGRTFAYMSPTLRIDYILVNKQFKVLQTKRDKILLSDHYPVITDLQLPAAAEE